MIFGRKNQQESGAKDSGLTSEAVLEVLRTVNDPELHRSLVELNMVRDIIVTDGVVDFEVVLTTPACPLKNTIEDDCTAAVSALPGVEKVNIRWASQVPKSFEQQALPGVKNVIAVASGKGGVGKSTVSVNIAAALQKAGANTGLLDCDIYGPSLPMMLDIHEQPMLEDIPDHNTGEVKRKMIPLEKYDLKLMSLGFLAPSDTAVIWRGPLVASAVRQMLTDTYWGSLDYLIVDLPPGTGDAPMSLAQQVPLSGVVVVMTPQDLATKIAGKSVRMFRSENLTVPVLGIIENMATFVCPHCQNETDIFGHKGAAEQAAKDFGVRFLGRLPLDPRIVEDSDKGVPTVIAAPESRVAEEYRSIASEIAAEVSVQALRPVGSKTPPVEFASVNS
ncbi:MAG: Mrp/NBP35 family ATP-binding protein [Armatimonadetes bacterium]|nr:Mrp/NBP35 family ATP-binding protein [Armatimonadota bacterium]